MFCAMIFGNQGQSHYALTIFFLYEECRPPLQLIIGITHYKKKLCSLKYPQALDGKHDKKGTHPIVGTDRNLGSELGLKYYYFQIFLDLDIYSP